MHSDVNHIISTVVWDTSFDQKEKAIDLQRRISSWSKVTLHREIADILDKLCPQDQTWRINSLRLDLGEILFENLESDLSEKLRMHLQEKLTELIISASGTQSDIEILNSAVSQLEHIRFFLLHGIPGWSYKPDEGTIDDLLAVQLSVNNRDVINMLRQAGVTHENVRKRIAWQLCEANLKSILRGLEPTNYTLITDFSEELIKIQSKESVVKASTPDFKKNVWLWILNHLLTERGSLFNKVVFMRSNIRQMANHYNLAYQDLLNLIVTAVKQVSATASVKSDFFNVIRFLSEESETSQTFIRQAHQEKSEQPDWDSMRQFLLSPKAEYSTDERLSFNGALMNLAASDPEYFGVFVTELKDNRSDLKKRLHDLNETSLALIFDELVKDRQTIYNAAIQLIHELSRHLKWMKDPAEIWRIGLSFLLEKTTSENDLKIFINSLISSLAVNNRMTNIQILEELTTRDIPDDLRSVASLEVMEHLISIHRDQVVQQPGLLFTEKLQSFFELADKNAMKRSSGKLILKEELTKLLRYAPADLLNLLAESKNRKELINRVFSLPDHSLLLDVLKKSTHHHAPFIIALHRHLVGSEKSHSGNTLFQVLSRHLLLSGILQLIQYSDSGEHAFIQGLKNNLRKKLPVSEHTNLDLFFKESEVGSHSEDGLLDDLQQHPDSLETLSDNAPFSLTRVIDHTTDVNGQSVLGKYLRLHFKDSGFVLVRKKSDRSETQMLLDYLVPGGMFLFQKMCTNPLYLTLPEGLKTQSERRNLLREIFWKCAVNTDLHKGSKLRFKQMFEEALCYEKLQEAQTSLPEETINGRKAKSINNTAPSALIEKKYQKQVKHVETCLEKTAFNLEQENQEGNFAETITWLLENHPEKLREVLVRVPITKKRIDMLNQAVSLGRWTQVLSRISDFTGGEEMKSVLHLFHLVQELASGACMREVEFLCRKHTWQMLKEKKSNQADYKKLVDTVLKRIQLEAGVTSDHIANTIKRNADYFTGTIKRAIAAVMPAVLENQKDESATALYKIEKAGLMDVFYDKLLWAGELPFWFDPGDHPDSRYWIEKLVKHDPGLLLEHLKKEKVTDSNALVLHRFLGFKNLATGISNSDKSQEPLMSMLKQVYDALGRMSFKSVSSADVRLILFRKLLIAWTTNNWRIVSTTSLLTELIWDLAMTKGLSKKDFLNDLDKSRFMLPVSLHVSLDALLENEKHQAVVIKEIPVKEIKKTGHQKAGNLPEKRTGIVIRNAGLVLVCGYMTVLFERLGIVADGKFKNSDLRKYAVHFLQYVTTGLCKTEESLLPLNKILCGLDLSEPIQDQIDMTPQQKELINGLVKAIISHWPAIGDCSIEGLRGNWLVREGILFESEDKWELTVEKRSYDILIHKSPLSFSIIKFPWMTKPLHVSWPY